MKSNKLWSILMMFFVVLGTTITLSSCGSDKDDDDNSGSGNSGNGIAGLWYPEKHMISDTYYFWNEFGNDGAASIDGNQCRAYRFRNSDTVEEIWTTMTTQRPSSSIIHTFKIDKFTVYVKQERIATYSYAKSGNTIYITNGDVLTLSDGQLHSNGGLIFDKIN